MRIEPGSKLLMIGDSVTDAERARPTGEGLFNAIGRGYVADVDALLGAIYPAHRIRVVNMGTSGNTARDLKNRWETDVIGLKPDWLSIMIGANDVWRQYDSPLQPECHVYIDEYEATLEALATRTRPLVKGLVLMAPYYIETNRTDAMRATMDRYGDVVRALAARHEALFVDTQAAFDEALEHYYPATLSWDRVHPSHIGAMIIARAFLSAVDFAW